MKLLGTIVFFILIINCFFSYSQIAVDTIPKKQKTNFFIEVNYCSGTGSSKNQKDGSQDYSYGFRFVEGQPLTEQILIGFGVGIDRYEDATLLPISVDARWRFVKGSVNGIFNPNLGYALGLKKAHGGFLINPSIGIEAPSKDKNIYLLAIGFKLQKQRVTHDYYSVLGDYYSETENLNLQFITFSAGLKF